METQSADVWVREIHSHATFGSLIIICWSSFDNKLLYIKANKHALSLLTCAIPQ